MQSSVTYKRAAKESLCGQWGTSAVFTLVFFVIVYAVAFVASLVGGTSDSEMPMAMNPVVLAAQILIVLPLTYAYMVAFLGASRGEQVRTGMLAAGFNDYLRVVGTLLLRNVYVWLWTLLLVVPGIVKYYSYAMTEYVLADYPELSYNAAIERSMAMMKGHKMELFLLTLTFIGWWIVCAFTLGIAMLWVHPYFNVTVAKFYEDLKQEETRIY